MSEHAMSEQPRTLTVRFPDFRTARHSIEQLEQSGLDGSNIAFDQASRERAAHAEESGARDERFLQRAASQIGRGVLVGAAVGFLAGLVMGLALFADGPMAGLVATLIATTAAGGFVGVAMGGIWRHEQSPAWEETFEAPETGEAILRVTVTNEDDLAIVRHVLDDNGGELQDAPR